MPERPVRLPDPPPIVSFMHDLLPEILKQDEWLHISSDANIALARARRIEDCEILVQAFKLHCLNCFPAYNLQTEDVADLDIHSLMLQLDPEGYASQMVFASFLDVLEAHARWVLDASLQSLREAEIRQRRSEKMAEVRQRRSAARLLLDESEVTDTTAATAVAILRSAAFTKRNLDSMTEYCRLVTCDGAEARELQNFLRNHSAFQIARQFLENKGFSTTARKNANKAAFTDFMTLMRGHKQAWLAISKLAATGITRREREALADLLEQKCRA